MLTSEIIRRERALYRAYVKRAQDLGVAVPTKSYLRQDLTILNGQQTYDFNYLSPNQQTNTALPEKFLKLTDAFIITQLGFFLLRETTASRGAQILQTFPNSTQFPPVAGPPAFVPTDLNIFYNATAQVRINQTIIYNDIDTQRSLMVPQTQQSATVPYSQYDIAEQAFIPLDPHVKFFGSCDNHVTVSIPTFSTMAVQSQTAGVVHKYVAVARGFLIPGAGDSKFIEKFSNIEELADMFA